MDGQELRGAVRWAEVSGFAWEGETPLRDIMLVIDISATMRIASGLDVDGDGYTGQFRLEGRRWLQPASLEERISPIDAAYLSSDRDDTVIAAALAAARRFVERVDLTRTRVGIVTFDSHARVRMPLTDDRASLVESIEGLRRRMTRTSEGLGTRSTATGFALATAGDALVASRDPAVPRRMELLVLTDALPSLPVGHAPEFMVAVSMVLTERDIRTHFFPLGPSALWNAPFFDFLDERAGTSHTDVASLAQIDERLANARLDEVAAIEIGNETSGEPAQAVRLFTDGSFDGFVRLEDGPNRILVRALATDGTTRDVALTVGYAHVLPTTRAEARAQQAEVELFLDTLETRAVESALLVEMREARETAVRRSLEIEASRADGPDAGVDAR